MKNSNTTKTAKPLRNLTPQAKPIQTLQELAKNLRSDCFYFVSQFGLGDTYFLLGFRQALEEKFGGKIIFVIQPSHEVVCEMFECVDYEICSDTRYIYSAKFPALQQFKNTPKVPKLGTLYPAHPIPLGVLQSLKHKDMKDMYIKFFDLKSNAILAKPSKMPALSENLRAKITKIAPLEKIVFYLPEANSMECLPYFVFKIECLQLQKQGYTIITNITKAPHYLKISGVIDLNLSMKEVVALALACKRVISMRSGFCDIIALNCKDLKVYYPNDESLKGSNLKVIDESVSAKEVVLMDLADFAEKINSLLPLKLYNRYIAKGFLKRLRTPFTAYFKIYKKHKANETQNEIKPNIMRDFSRNFGLNETEFETFSEIQSELENSYEYQLGRLLEKACKAFWLGGFVIFPFAYFKLRKQKKKLTRLNEILG